MECCRVDDTSPENRIVGLPPGWVDTDVSRLYISINPHQPVVRGRPRGFLQSLGCRSDALTARWWSWLESERVTWPKNRSRLVSTILETGGQSVVSLTEALVTCPIYRIRAIHKSSEFSLWTAGGGQPRRQVQVQYEICRLLLYSTSRSAVQESPISMIKKCTFEPFLNVLVSVTSCASDGRLFQAAGLEKQKPPSPNLVLVLVRA